MGYRADQRGIAVGLVTITTTIVGAVFGGWLTTLAGLQALVVDLWIPPALFQHRLLHPVDSRQARGAGVICSNRIRVADVEHGHRCILRAAAPADRNDSRRLNAPSFPACSRCLASSPRPITGFAVAAIGWSSFFLTTLVIGVPGLLMLNRFAPFGVREPQFEHEAGSVPPAAAVSGLVRPGLTQRHSVWRSARRSCFAVLDAMDKECAPTPDHGFDVASALWRLTHPADPGGWVQIVGILTFALVGGMFIAATRVRRAESQASR